MVAEGPTSQVREDRKLGPFGPHSFCFCGAIGDKVICLGVSWGTKVGE